MENVFFGPFFSMQCVLFSGSFCFDDINVFILYFFFQFVHCVVWAKDLLFAKLFGDKSQVNDLNVRSSDSGDSSKNTEDVFEQNPDEDLEKYGQRIYDHVFGYNIEIALANEETWKNRKKPRPIYMKDVLPDWSFQKNGYLANGTNDGITISAMPTVGLTNPQDIWSLAENTKVFLEALSLFFKKRDKVYLLLNHEIYFVFC